MNPPLLPPFRLCYIHYTVVSFNVTGPDVEQFIDAQTSAPEYPQHEVVALATLVRRRKHLIDLLLFEVVRDVLH